MGLFIIPRKCDFWTFELLFLEIIALTALNWHRRRVDASINQVEQVLKTVRVRSGSYSPVQTGINVHKLFVRQTAERIKHRSRSSSARSSSAGIIHRKMFGLSSCAGTIRRGHNRRTLSTTGEPSDLPIEAFSNQDGFSETLNA